MKNRTEQTGDMMLTVIIPCHNETEEELNKSLGSVSGLGISSYEVLVIDNNSDEDTAGFLKAYCQPRKEFHYIPETVRGVSAARNRGIAESRGKYILFLDADDYIFGDSLEQVFKENKDLMEGNGADQFLFDERCIGGSIRWFPDKWGGHVTWEEAAEKLLTAQIPGFSASLYRRNFLAEHEIYFPYGVRMGEDHIFSLAFWQAEPVIYYIPVYLYYYNFDAASRMGRYASDPSGSLEELLYEKKYKKEFVRNADYLSAKAAGILHLLDKRCMDALFSELLYLSEGGVAADEIREKVRGIYLGFDIGEMKEIKSRLEYEIVARKLWFLLPIICKVRNVRQRMKHVRR